MVPLPAQDRPMSRLWGEMAWLVRPAHAASTVEYRTGSVPADLCCGLHFLSALAGPVSAPTISSSASRRIVSLSNAASSCDGSDYSRVRVKPSEGSCPLTWPFLVGARGFEPLASSASRKRSTPELSARSPAWYRRAEAGTGI